ncbi:MAG: kelch repeat-containing protein [Elusimicrobiota bacterium]
MYSPITFLFILLIIQNVFALSTMTYTTSSDFVNFTRDGIKVAGTGTDSKLTLISDWEEKSITAQPAPRYSAGIDLDTVTMTSLMFGGREDSGAALADVWLFDCLSKKWTQKTPQPRPSARYGCSVVAISSGTFLLFGGQDNSGEFFNDTWIYISSANLWYSKAFLVSPSSRAYFSLGYSPGDNRVYLFGGVRGTNIYNDIWRYDVVSSSWSLVDVGVSSPSPRFGQGMVYNSSGNCFIVFGGQNNSNVLDDLWLFYPSSSTWTQKNPIDSNVPSQRTDFFFDYIESSGKFLLYGGWTGFGLSDETWIYDPVNNRWSSAAYRPDQTRPSARNKIQALYYSANMLGIFGGNDGTSKGDFWVYEIRSSGTFIASMFTQTAVDWQKLINEDAILPSSTSIKFQISSSENGIDWTSFVGYNGSESAYYSGIGTYNIWAGHQNKKFLKVKGFLESEISPVNPEILEFKIVYNIPPGVPSTVSPGNNSRINSYNPVFSWNAAVDSDGDSLYYGLQVSNLSDFTNNRVNKDYLTQNQYQPQGAEELSPGVWYWRVFARDSSTGPWSQPWSVVVDTIAPSYPEGLTAMTGMNNGSVIIRFISPGDDGTVGDIVNGNCIVRYSSYVVISDENKWNSSAEQILPFSSYQGAVSYVTVGSLVDATTYYFALKIKDPAGNVSQMSGVSPSAATNSPPEVTIIAPVAGEILSRDYQIKYTYTDVDSDPVNSSITLSSDSGKNYSITIASGLADGTTYYIWNTRIVSNGSFYRLKVRVTDSKGLYGEKEMTGDFIVDNVNEQPQISLFKPLGGEVTSGLLAVSWKIDDPNLTDIHNVYIYLSSSVSAPFFLADSFIPSGTFYLLDTTRFVNSPSWRLKIKAVELNTPDKYSSNEVISGNFAISNGNFSPNSFSLLSPADGSEVQVIKVELSWESKGDPNPEDLISYTLFYSTKSDLSFFNLISGITDNKYVLDANVLQENKKYYWSVKAVDPLGAFTYADKTFSFNTLERTKAASQDGRFKAEIISGMPDGSFLKIEKIDVSLSDVVSAAEKNSLPARHLKTLGDNVYSVEVVDINHKKINITSADIRLEMKYSDTDNNGYYDGTWVPCTSLRIAKIDEDKIRWEIPQGEQIPDTLNKKVSANVTGLSYFTIAGSNLAVSLISGINIFPNPFNPDKENVKVLYVLNEDSSIDIRIYSLVGELVRIWNFFARGNPNGITNEIIWDGKNGQGRTVSNGMYLLIIKASGSKAELTEKRYIGVVK